MTIFINMKEVSKIVKGNFLYAWLLPIGGIFFMVFGIYQLLNPFEMDNGGLPNWMLGIFFFPFGVIAFIHALDFRYLIIGKDQLEIKSLFRKRIIRKSEVMGYGVEDYEGRYVSGERIRIRTKKNSYKFHTSQFSSIEEVKQFVKGKPVQKDAFQKERISNTLAYLFLFVFMLIPFTYEKCKAPTDTVVEAIGIPVKVKVDLKILEETKDELRFELKEYKDFIFTVGKNKIPENMSTTDKQLIVFIMNQEQVAALSDKANPKTISVDNIDFLE